MPEFAVAFDQALEHFTHTASVLSLAWAAQARQGVGTIHYASSLRPPLESMDRVAVSQLHLRELSQHQDL